MTFNPDADISGNTTRKRGRTAAIAGVGGVGVLGILALIAAVFPATLEWVADVIGIEVPINLVFFVSIAILFFVALQTSSELTTLEVKTRVLAERVAIIQTRLDQLETEAEPDPDPGRDRARPSQ